MLPPSEQMHPRIREIVDYWRSIHRPEGLPGLKQIDPTAIPSLLRNIWILDVERDPYRFRFRLVGDAVAASTARVAKSGSAAASEPAAGGRTLSAARKGGYLDELHGGPLPPRMMEGFVRVIERHEPDWYRGEPLTAHTRWVETIERVALPLATDGATVDSILNLTIYGRQGR